MRLSLVIHKSHLASKSVSPLTCSLILRRASTWQQSIHSSMDEYVGHATTKKRIARQQVITKWMLRTKFLIRAGSGVCIAVTASDPFNPAVHSIFLTHHGVNDCAREMDHIVCGLPSESKRQIRVIGSSYRHNSNTNEAVTNRFQFRSRVTKTFCFHHTSSSS